MATKSIESLTTEEQVTFRTEINAETAGAAAAAAAAAVSNADYEESGWNGVTTVAPSKNVVRDKFEAMDAAKQPLDSDLTAFAAGTPATALGDSTAQANRRGMIGAVGTALEITTALQGVEADATRIGTEYMPEIVDVDGVTLADSSAVELPSGTLGLNADGRLVIHDFATTGGIDAEGMILRGLLSHTVSDSIAADQIIEIASGVIPAAMLTNNEYFSITGSIFIRNQLSGYEPSGNPSLVLYLCDAAGARNTLAEPEDGYRMTLATAAAPAQHTTVELGEIWQASVAGSLLSLTTSNITGSTRMRTLTAGVATETEKIWALNGSGNERTIAYGGVGQFAYLKIGLFLPADAATADVTGSITVSCDLRILKA